jgi:hypothetical protein
MGDVTCIDKPPPHVGDRHVRVCECRPGYTYSEEGGCHLAHVPHDDDNTDNDNHGHHDDVHDLDDDNDDLEHDAKIGDLPLVLWQKWAICFCRPTQMLNHKQLDQVLPWHDAKVCVGPSRHRVRVYSGQ